MEQMICPSHQLQLPVLVRGVSSGSLMQKGTMSVKQLRAFFEANQDHEHSVDVIAGTQQHVANITDTFSCLLATVAVPSEPTSLGMPNGVTMRLPCLAKVIHNHSEA